MRGNPAVQQTGAVLRLQVHGMYLQAQLLRLKWQLLQFRFQLLQFQLLQQPLIMRQK